MSRPEVKEVVTGVRMVPVFLAGLVDGKLVSLVSGRLPVRGLLVLVMLRMVVAARRLGLLGCSCSSGTAARGRCAALDHRAGLRTAGPRPGPACPEAPQQAPVHGSHAAPSSNPAPGPAAVTVSAHAP